jgi:predicted metal-dependent hydrolase
LTKIQQKLHYGTSIIDYSIVRSRGRKTSEIIVDEENVIVRTPYDKSIEEINDIVREKANWIRTKQSEYRLRSPEIVKHVFQEGSTLPYLGSTSFEDASGRVGRETVIFMLRQYRFPQIYLIQAQFTRILMCWS